MITKIKKLRGIGVYHDCSARGEGLDFKKNTAIYANNAYGKSTLVAVLRSFKDDCSEIIEGRKTLGEQFDQHVVISVPGGTLTYKNGKWGQHMGQGDCLKISIFDETYVQNNLFVKEIESSHRKKIYRLVVGEEGKKLSGDLNAAIQNEKEKRGRLQAFEKELEEKNKEADIENYLKISEDVKLETEQKIVEIDKQIIRINNSNKIETLLGFDSVEFIPLDISDIRVLLSKSFEDFHIEAKEKVSTHIEKHMQEDDRTEEFISLGTVLQKEGCPFCGQALDDSLDLIEAYKSYFDDAYNAFQQSLQEKIAFLKNWDFRAEIIKIQHWMNACESQITSIKQKAGEEAMYEVEEYLNTYIGKIDSVIKNLVEVLRGKQLNPSGEYSNEALQDFDKTKENIDQEIKKFQSHLDATKTKYTHLVETSLGKTIDELKTEKKVLQRRIFRFTDEEECWCLDYITAANEAEESEKNLERLVQKTSGYTRNLFKVFEKGVNDYLKKLRAQFQIGGVSSKTDKVSKEAYVDFNIVLRKQDIALKSRSRNPQPEFSNTLSNGDRNTLSLAFFFAWLDMQPDLEELVVVIDDPLTSMDDNRRLGTAQVLGELSNNVKQLVVLTHKLDFLFQLDDELSNLHGLSIKHDDKNGSEIIPFDIKSKRKDKHCQRIDEMHKYLNEDFGPSVQDMQENIRKAIEKVLKIKYYPDLEDLQTLKPMLDYLAENQYLDQGIIEKLRKLKDISSPVHHAEEHGRPIQNLVRQDLIPEIEKTLEIIKTI